MSCSIDRKSTRLNSSHLGISYAVFCLKKKKKKCQTHLPKCPTSRHAAPTSHTPRTVEVRRPFELRGGMPGCSVDSYLVFFFFLRFGRPPRFPLFPSRPLSH